MKKLFLTAAAFLIAGSAQAQVLGGRVGGTVGGAVSTSGSIDARAPDVTPTIDRTTDTVTRTTDTTARTSTRTVRRNSVQVEAGASVRVNRGQRCYYYDDYNSRDYYYRPTYHDGYYYCERQSSSVGAGASVGTRQR